MDSRKNRGMSKLFPCFRPDAVDEDGLNASSVHRNNGKPPLPKRKIMMNSSDESSFTSSSSSDDADSSVDGDGGGSDRSKGSSRRRFSRAIKAVFFDTSLSRKIRERKSRKNSLRSSDKTRNINHDKSSSSFEELSEAEEMNRNNSSRSSIFSSTTTNGTSSLSSSCASSRNAESMDRRGSTIRILEKNGSFVATTNQVERKEALKGMKLMESQRQKSAEKKLEQYYSSTIGLCLLLVSLLVLVFWGRICAIFCTSVWLFFGPRRIKGFETSVKVAKSMNVDSEEYKKRVIMEGLLERNRSRSRAAQ